MGARFPGADGTLRLWRLLCDGGDAIGEIPVTRFDCAALGLPRHAGILDGIDHFDARFFGISPREAQRMDPQQRLTLEVAWEALEDAGQPPLALRGTATGVFLGVHRDEYAQVLQPDLMSATGASRSGVAGRVSYMLGLEGPSLALDTDRSSSLVAVQLACQSLRLGECELALAGGINLLLTPELGTAFARAGMLARDGRIKFCDARADGIVRSDGAGVVVLKPLAAARRDGDRVYAVVLGGAINHDGGRSGDLMTPSAASQAALLRAACADAGVAPHAVQYVEAHGTGTVVGDPVEVAAVADVLQRDRGERPAVRIGSIKTNIGHTEAAAGIAGLIKVALAVKHRRLPASAHFSTPNPRIRFDGVEVQASMTSWPDAGRPLVAGVTSLGLTGTNAHVILGEPPPPELPSTLEMDSYVLPVSARGRAALEANVRAYVELLRRADAPALDAIARSAALRRSHLEDRVAVVGRTREEIAAAFDAWLARGVVASHELATPYMAGETIDWATLYPGSAPVLDLPRYGWQRERYWHDAETETRATTTGSLGGTTPHARRDQARELVTRELVRVLGVNDASTIDVRRPFRELGVTSLLGMELVARIGNAVLGRPLPSSAIFDHPDVAALAEHLANATPAAVVAPVVRVAPAREPIAVIGMSCRFPGGAADPERYWHVLRDGIDAISEVPRARWNLDDWYDPEPGQPGKMRTRWGGFIEDIERFDAAFFGISPREAEEMDPQQRLLLEVTWDALERAGLPADRLLGVAAGVFLGMMNHNDYASRKRLHDDPARIRAHHGTGTAMSVAAGRLAYLLGVTGPALVVDTACSSSLVAVHLAMQSLRDGSCRIALAGGVNAIVSPEASVAYSQAGMLSPTGRCRTFDASADGYVRSEGCGIVVLKRLSDAIADGDRVRAVLLGAAVNQDGRSAGLTAPNGQAQRAVIRAALADAGVTPADVDYVEAHGTGTRLGDPIEVQSLGDVFRERSGDPPLYVGSAKASVGHLEAAAGVAGLMKVILAIEHAELPPQVHLRERNPLLGADALPIAFPTQRTPWASATSGRRRVAGVSSFGMSGTNAHLIVAEPPAAIATAIARSPETPRHAELVVFSARSDTALAELAGRHAAHLALRVDTILGDVAHALATTRSHHDQRMAIVASDRGELYDAFARAARRELPARAVRGDATTGGKRAWLFTGQGAQWPGMGRELAATEPVFARALEEIVAALDAHLARPLLDVMWAEPGSADAALLDQTGFTQPALFAIEVALARLWRAWGAEPDFVAGHSVGEIAAAHVAGVFSLDDAARLVAARARLMQALPAGGAMYAIAASEAEVATWVAPEAGGVSIAGVNGPASVVIAGDETRVAVIADRFARRGVRTNRLTVSHAFHSPLMEPMLGPFRAVAETVRFARPRVPGAGNVDGRLWDAEAATAEYWVRHVRAPVRFADGARALGQAGVRTFVELGPRPTLLSMVPADATARLAVMRPDRPASLALEALGGWYAAGGSVDWNGVMPGPHRRVDLPTYPWQRQRFWISPPPPKATATARDVRVLSIETMPGLADHRVGGEVVVPAAAMIEWLRADAERIAGRDTELRSLVVRAPLSLADGETRAFDTVVTADERGARRVVLQSRHDATAPWVVHAEADIHTSRDGGTFDLAAARERCSVRGDVDALYASLADDGLDYGPSFRGVRELWRGHREVLARVAAPAGWPDEVGAHPAIIDAALQLAVADADGLYLPFACERVRVDILGATEAWASIRFTSDRAGDTIAADLTLVDSDGAVIAVLDGFRARRTTTRATRRANDIAARDSLWRLAWRAAPERDSRALGETTRIAVVGDGFAAELAAALSARGVRCAHVGDDLDGIDAPDHVICAWDGGAAHANDDVPARSTRLCVRTLAVAKKLIGQSSPLRVWWITRGAAAVAPSEATDLAAASLWGLGRTLRLEHPEVALRLVDLPANSDAAAIEAALAELAHDDQEPEVAWRGGRRYVARVESAALGATVSRALRTDGTVIITGGLGGIGVHIARVLARRGVRHLVLTGRRGEATSSARELVDELRAAGTEVSIIAADVSSRDACSALIDAIPMSRPLRGIVHAAGVIDDGVITELTADRLAAVLAPKAAGAWHLHELTREQDLDIFVMFSSVAGTFGSPGQASYAAANAFLDGVVASRRALGLRAQSLAWGPWDGVGMSASLDVSQRQRWARRGFHALSVERALALFEHALDRDDAQLVVAPMERAASPAPATAPTRTTTAPAAGTSVLATVRAEVARLLALGGPDDVAVDRPLASLGLDSLMALELRNALGKRVGRSLPTTLAFDHPTAAAIARFLDDTPRVSAAPVAAVRATDEPIAIIGYGCRFPGGVHDPDSFWRLLADGVDAIEEHPRDRWDIDAYYDPDPATPGKTYTREGGFLHGLDQFDAEFFEISPREAADMDPQQRLLLETGWEALERAGIAPASLMERNVGVFVGVMSHEYFALQGANLERRDGYVTTGSLGSVASGRLSYALGVRGPSMTIDTACSSSLVATHLACQALRAGECELALAGGATVVLTPSLFVEFSRLRGLSRDGRCKSFAAGADGVIWAEGCGVLALKRLADARRDGDRVLAVIAGSAVNQDGRSQGLTAPSGPAQEEVIRRALAQARVAPADIDYVEAHGTGTKLGDPIEMRALGAVLREGRGPSTPVVVGSFKSNIGHAQAAAGVGAIIKTVLALQHELIPQSLHFDAPSPHIPWDELPVRVAATAEPWPRRGGRKRIAGVSSFGISGTNAHVILEEAPAHIAASPQPSRPAELLVVSARTDAALAKAADELARFVRVHGEVDLGEIAATLARGREHHRHRLAIAATSRDQAAHALEVLARGDAAPRGARRGTARAEAPPTAWLFTGQGSQWAGMGRGLATDWPVFRDALDRCFAAFVAHLPRLLAGVMWATPGSADAALLDQTGFTQPALFAYEVALAALWRSWGIEPSVLVGHSIGEIAAAHVAGVLSLEDAARLVAARGRLMQALPAGGAMAAIAATESTVAAALADHADVVSIAAVNAPESIVISGEGDAVDRIAADFAARGVRTTRLVVSHAFHSPLMEPMLDAFRAVAARVTYHAPSLPLVSNATGALAGDEIRSADYWVQHVRGAVRFAAGARAAHEAGARAFLEIGPRPILSGLVAGCLPSAPRSSNEPETAAVLDALGALHVGGAAIEWRAIHAGRVGPVDLPTYPWQRRRYWIEPRRAESTAHPFLRTATTRPDGKEHCFTAELSRTNAPWLADHVVHGVTLFPGTGLVELLLAAGRRHGADAIHELTIEVPIVVPARGALAVQIWVQGANAIVYGRPADAADDAPWTRHATAVLATASVAPPSPAREWPPSAEPLLINDAYGRLSAIGLQYGPAFRGVTAMWRSDTALYAAIDLPDAAGDASPFAFHPALLDAALHPIAAELAPPGAALVPFAWRDIELYATGARHLRVTVTIVEQRGDNVRVTLEGRDKSGALVIRVGDLLLVRAATSTRRDVPLFAVQWQPARARPRAWVATAVLGGGGVLAERLGLPRFLDVPALFTAGGPPPAMVLVDATGELPGDVIAQTHAATHHVLALLQACLADERLAATDIVWVTQGAIAATPTDAVPALVRSPLWGLIRSARREHTRRRLRLLDLEVTNDAARVRDALAIPNELELALRGDDVLVPRVEPAVPLRKTSFDTALAGARSGSGRTVLVTGATGALGAHVARHLVAAHGARRLILASRRGAAAPGATALRDEIAARGADIVLATCDASRREDVAALLRAIPADAPLCEVFHCAGVVDDGVVTSLDPARVDRVLAAKVDAAVHLDELTRTLAPRLERFVLFSSVAGVLGTAGQGSYAAANTFLDAIAARRAHDGLPAQSLAWGLWESSSTGMSAKLGDADLARLRRQGITPLTLDDGLALLDRCLERAEPLLVPARLDLTAPARPAPLRTATSTAADATAPVPTKPRNAADVLDIVRTEIAGVFRLPTHGVSDDQPLRTLGLDSLMAIELRDRLAARLEMSLPASVAFDHPAATDLSRHVTQLLFGEPAPPPAPPAPPPSTLDELTNEELVRLVRSL